jgi:hypothetical protein
MNRVVIFVFIRLSRKQQTFVQADSMLINAIVDIFVVIISGHIK